MFNFLKRITSLLKQKSYWVRQGTALFGDTPYQPTKKDYLDVYEASFLVNSCIKKIADKTSIINLHLYKITGMAGREKVQEIDNHPLLDLLAQVNPFTTRSEMISGTVAYEELLGNSYWLKVRGERTNKPLELWQLRPDWVKIIEDPEKIIKGYEYTLPNGSKQPFDAEDVIHFKQFNPKSSFYGLPTVAAAMDIIRSSIFSARWNMKFFYNSARPDALLVSKTGMSKESKEELKRQWMGEYGGVEGAHKLGLLEGEIEYKPLNLTMREMEFSKLTTVSTDQVLAAFGVPKTLLGFTETVNRSVAESAIYIFLSEVIEPRMRRMVEKLNEFLVPEFGDDLYLDFEDPTPENRDAIVKEYDSALKNNWMVINEVRDRENLPPLEGGWDFYLPITLVPGGGLQKVKGLSGKEYYKQKEQKEQERLIRKILTGRRKLKLKMKLNRELRKFFADKLNYKMTEEIKQNYWKEHDKLLTSDEKLFMVFMRTLLKKQEERIQDALESEMTGKGLTKVLDQVDWNIEDTVFAELSIPIFSDIFQRRGTRAGKLVGVKFTFTERIREAVKKKSMVFAEQVNNTTKDKLKATLSEGIKEGEGVPELSKRVGEVFKSRKKWETVRIARTEVLSASNEASLEAYIQSEVVEKKEWLATMDERTRDEHAAMNGEVVGLKEKFSNGEMYPISVNCRCTVIPVVN